MDKGKFIYLIVFWDGTQVFSPGKTFTPDHLAKVDGKFVIIPDMARMLVNTFGKAVREIKPAYVSCIEVDVDASSQAEARREMDKAQEEKEKEKEEAYKEIATRLGDEYLPKGKFPEKCQAYYDAYFRCCLTEEEKKGMLTLYMKKHGFISKEACPDVLFSHYEKARKSYLQSVRKVKCPDCGMTLWRKKNEDHRSPLPTCPDCKK